MKTLKRLIIAIFALGMSTGFAGTKHSHTHHHNDHNHASQHSHEHSHERGHKHGNDHVHDHSSSHDLILTPPYAGLENKSFSTFLERNCTVKQGTGMTTRCFNSLLSQFRMRNVIYRDLHKKTQEEVDMCSILDPTRHKSIRHIKKKVQIILLESKDLNVQTTSEVEVFCLPETYIRKVRHVKQKPTLTIFLKKKDYSHQ